MIDKIVDKLIRILDELKIIRRVTLFWMMYLTTISYKWVFDFLDSMNMNTIDAETSLIIAAVLSPITLLQGAVFKMYSDGRNIEIREIKNVG